MAEVPAGAAASALSRPRRVPDTGRAPFAPVSPRPAGDPAGPDAVPVRPVAFLTRPRSSCPKGLAP
ncbi:hypothetical protein BN2537_2827 [Streptomyces venezuelae]|nr:hypothetical protein BN2537_2827 [Streptomyces venezuelae]